MGKFLRFLGIILMGLTAALTLLSGIGTTCVSLDAAKYEGMEAIAQYQWLYIFYVLAAIAIGIMGIRATIALVKGTDKSYRDALIALVLGVVVGGIHMATSRALRDGGSSMPLDFIVYATVFTLIIFLLFGIPKLREMVGFERESSDNVSGAAGGMAAIVAGMLFLSVQMWAGPTHIFDGVNLADAFHTSMMVSGGGLTLVGLGLLARAALASSPAAEKSPQNA
ncbi:MAG: hypothetical protein DRI56_03845 [Chloroflexota bacterium]|nr:MAG: hypothetical protein DRI56_03845 [Chloroflexota bacterium]